MADTKLARFIGGSPIEVFARLLFVSLVVGALLVWLDVEPLALFRGLRRLVERLWGLGFEAVNEVGRYILVGAMVVVPVWLALRLISARKA